MNTFRQSPNLTTHLHSLSKNLHDLVFPPRCVGCGAMGAEFCPRCAQSVKPVGSSICRRCGRGQSKPSDGCSHCTVENGFVLEMARAAAYHRSPLRQAIHAFKYEEQPELAGIFGNYLTAAFQMPPWPNLAPATMMVVPVPLHADRLRERGFNQSELIARAFCQRTGLILEADALQRTRHTPHQVGLNAADRRQNVAAAFEASPTVTGKTLLLIDDVYTTGATLNACARAARDAGAAQIYALTLAIPWNVNGQ